MKMKFWDIDSECVVTEEQLRGEYEELVQSGELEDCTFWQFLRDCTGKNGTLEVIEEEEKEK